MRAQDSRLLYGELGSLTCAVRLVQLVFLLPLTECVGRVLLLPVPNVALVVVGEAGALWRSKGCAWAVHNGVRCQGGVWLGVRQLAVVSWLLFLLVL